MNAIDLKALGFTQEELQERVIDRICQQFIAGIGYDEDEDYYSESVFAKKLNAAIAERIDAQINDLAENHVLPNVSAYIENLVLQETNKWGERTGKQVTFIEYLTQRAEAYMQEGVNYDGKVPDHYSSGKTQTRITYLVNNHLHYSIEKAMKDALQVANSAIATGIQETVKLKLGEIVNGLQVSVKTK